MVRKEVTAVDSRIQHKSANKFKMSLWNIIISISLYPLKKMTKSVITPVSHFYY